MKQDVKVFGIFSCGHIRYGTFPTESRWEANYAAWECMDCGQKDLKKGKKNARKV